MAEEQQYFAPLGPYKEYAPDGEIGQLPPAPQADQTFTDPRTGVYYGAYTEEEILDDQVKIMGNALYRGIDPVTYTQNRIALDFTIKPEDERGTTNAGEIWKNDFQSQQLNMESGDLAAQALDLPLDEDDSGLLAESFAKSEESAKMNELSITDNRGLAFETSQFMAKQLGLLKHMGPEALKLIVPAATETVLNVTTPYKGYAGTKFAAAATAGVYFVKQMKGEIYRTLRDPREEIDRDIARDTANILGTVSGISEMLGFRNFLKAAGISTDVVTRITNIAEEGGQELFQSIVEDTALWTARKQQAERNGEAFDASLWASLDLEKAQEGARAGILTAGGFAVPAASVKYTSGAVRAVQEADKKYIIRKQATELIKSYNAKQAELVEASDKPTIPSTDPITGEQIEAAPLDSVEVDQMNSEDGVNGTTVTDGEVDDFMLLDDPAEIDAAAERLVSSVNNVDEAFTAGRFFSNLKAILPPEEATFVEQLMNARAASAGVDINAYINDRQIAIKEAGYKGGVNAEVTFTEEGRAIIRAFTGANVSSVLHEVGHVFRRDLRGQDLATVEAWAGVEPGQQWDTAAEEKFARAWERYLAEGKAPSQELIPAFDAFTKWITNIYKTIVGSDIDVEFDDGVRQVFDNLLVAQEGAKNELEPVKQQAMTLQQSRSGAGEAELQAKYQRELLERDAARDTAVAAAEGKLNPSKTLAEQIKAHRRVMRKLFSEGETEGAKNERNKIKALLKRQRNRADVQKQHTAVRKQIIKLLANNMPKKISRKLQSGMDYDTQNVITDLYKALMDVDQDQRGVPFLPVKDGLNTIEGVKQMYYKYIEGAVATEPLTPVQVLRNQIITAALKRDANGLAALQELYGQLGALVKMGKKGSPAMINLFKARGLVKTAVPQITGTTVEELNENIDKKDLEEASRQRQKEKSWRTKLATMKLGKDGLLAWGDLLELVSAYSGAVPGNSTLMQELDFFESSQAKKTDIRTQMGGMIEAYATAYGIRINLGSFEYHNSIHSQQNRDLKRDIDIGWNRIVNRAQLRQIWMYMQDPNLNERLVGNGIGAGQRQAVEREMTSQDRQFAQHLMNMFQDDANYQSTNEVYIRAFGVDLERFDNYVPLNAEPIQTTQQALEKDQDTMNQFQQDKYLRKSATSAGSLNKRIEDLRNSQLIFNGDLPLFQSWLEETAHFRAYADKVRLASAVVNNKDFRKAVVFEYGQKTYNAIQKNLIANAADARATSENINAVDRLRTAYVTGTIGMATTVTMKQYISLLNFWQDMPFTDYVAGMTSLPANIGLIKDILASDYLLNRRGSIDRDLKQAMNSKEYKRMMLNPSIKNFLTFNVTLGDSGAIAIGGAVYVRYLMKQINPKTGVKYTKAQAIHEMGRKADRTQQSASIEQLSTFQQGNSFAKIITTYSTGPVQATRQILAANRNLASGRISVPQYIKEMFIYQVAVPIMYSLAAGAIAGDDSEEQLKNAGIAAMLGPWGSTYAMGRIVTAAVRYASGMSYFENAGPFTDTVMDLAGYTNKIASEGWDSLTLDQYARATQSTLVLFGYGIPLTRVSRMAENAAAGEPVDAFFATNPNR